MSGAGLPLVGAEITDGGVPPLVFFANHIFQKQREPPSTSVDHKARQRHSSVGRVMVDAFGAETLAGLIHLHRLDGPNLPQGI